MSGIKPGSELFGVRYWAQWMPINTVPKYQLFRYFGHNAQTGLFHFQHYKHKSIWISRNFNQLASDPSFRPFLLDTSKLGVEYLVPGGPDANRGL